MSLLKVMPWIAVAILAVGGAFPHRARAEQTPATEEDMSVEEFMQGLSSVRKVLNRRDPFEENQPSYVKEEKTALLDEAHVESSADDLPPLERYSVGEYTVKAVLLGDAYPRALVKVPGGGSMVVEEKMRLGDKNGIIEKIDRTGLRVVEKIKNNFGSFDVITQQLSVGIMKAGGQK